MIKDTKRKGTNLENEFKDIFEKHDFIVTRAAGSFGIDLVGMKYNHKNILINVKWIRNYCGPKERKELLYIATRLDAIPILAYKSKKRYGKRMIEILTDVKTRGVALVLDGSKYDLENFLMSGPEKMMKELWKKKQMIDYERAGLPYHSEEVSKKLHFYNPQEK